MTETTITETTAPMWAPTPKLNAALAKVQAALPDVAKNNLATVPGKDGKQGYKYDYADLADCTKAILPLLGKNGLAFTSKPTMRPDGRFVLAYALAHESGERDCGEYPLRANSTPQALGGEITYARRYSLCAITGLAPGGDDDDAQAAQTEAASGRGGYGRDESWRDLPPVNRPRANGAANGNGNGHGPQDEQPQSAPADPEVIAEWATVIDAITCQADADKADTELKQVFTGGNMTPATAGAIRSAIKAKAAGLGSREESAQPTAEVLAWAKRIEDATDIPTLRAVSDEVKGARQSSASVIHDGQPVTLSQRWGARRAEIEAQMAGAPA